MRWELTIDKKVCYTPELCSIRVCEQGIKDIHEKLEQGPLIFPANNYNEELHKLLKMESRCPTDAIAVGKYEENK